jgi:hypothetical protein
MAQYISGEGDLDGLSKEDARWYTAQFLLSEEKFTMGDVAGSLKLVDKLQKVAALKNPLEKRFVRDVWALQEGLGLKIHGGRLPASASDTEETEQWLEKFKNRYEVP